MQLRSRDALVICLEATGMSERQLARVAGLSHATVNHLITGRRTGCTLATARAIETALGVGPGTLFESLPVEPAWPVEDPGRDGA
jgi:transcriptional regulator with XRE-family HTH domain